MQGQIKKNVEIIYPELSYTLNGIFFEVHRKTGRFSKEKQYADGIEMGLKEKGLPYKREERIYKEEKFTRNIVDFIVDDCIVVEIKAKKFITKEDYYQLKRYLISINKSLGLLVNFRDDFIKSKRVLNVVSPACPVGR
ncbi:MAG: GxxExxY protein [Candidatus Moranbacteria bacterium]|nr:GxxExxY protein [Candidatus Moranbacteria bacterium]